MPISLNFLCSYFYTARHEYYGSKGLRYTSDTKNQFAEFLFHLKLVEGSCVMFVSASRYLEVLGTTNNHIQELLLI